MSSQSDTIRFNMGQTRFWFLPAILAPFWAFLTYLLILWLPRIVTIGFVHSGHFVSLIPVIFSMIIFSLLYLLVAGVTAWSVFRAMHLGWIDIDAAGLAINENNTSKCYEWLELGEAKWLLNPRRGYSTFPDVKSAFIEIEILHTGKKIKIDMSDYRADREAMFAAISAAHSKSATAKT